MYVFSCTDDLQQYKEGLKRYYLNKLRQSESSRWPRLGDPSLYIEVTIAKAQYSSGRMGKDASEMEKFYEEHAMGLLDDKADVTYVKICNILDNGYGKVSLIEGDPGAGKTTLTVQICKQWAMNEVLKTDFVFWLPLRQYKSVKTLPELFDKLGCPKILEYAKKNSGEDLVFILDGWDELPNDLQEPSLFHKIVFTDHEFRIFQCSTVIVTSRPVSSDKIAELVEETRTHYQILGFSSQHADEYIEKYFDNSNSQTAKSLLAFLKDRENLRRHYYIPITVAIMCFVCRKDRKIPDTLSKLYERFVVLHIRPNVPEAHQDAIKKSLAFDNMPKNLKPFFDKLCKIAFNTLKDKELVFDEEQLEITEEEMKSLNMEHFDGFGLLHVDHYTNDWADRERSYTFIHRAVQELLAAIFVSKNCNIVDILDEHFYKGSYLLNMFPFLFGLVPKEHLRPLAGKLMEIYKSNRNRKLLSSILYCLFEAQDNEICSEFVQVFREKKEVNLQLASLLEYRYASYFLSFCGGEKLKVDLSHSVELTEPHAEVMAKFLQKTSTDIVTFKCLIQLTHKGMEHFAKVLSNQPNLLSVKLYSLRFLSPNCVKILCESISKHNIKLTELDLPYTKLSTADLDSLGLLLKECASLEELHMNESMPSKEVCLVSSQSFYDGLCNAKSLKQFCLGSWSLSWVESEAVGNILKSNKSLKELHAFQVDTVDCLGPILEGLSSNTSVILLRIWPKSTGASSSLGQCLENCLTQNRSLASIDFARYHGRYVSWSSTQVISICTGLRANTTVVILDISGCEIDTEACHAVCEMLSQNTTLQNFFLNPVNLEKQDAIAMIDSCRANTSLELLSLVLWPESEFQFSSDPDIEHLLQESQQNLTKPVFHVYWLVSMPCRCIQLHTCLCIVLQED